MNYRTKVLLANIVCIVIVICIWTLFLAPILVLVSSYLRYYSPAFDTSVSLIIKQSLQVFKVYQLSPPYTMQLCCMQHLRQQSCMQQGNIHGTTMLHATLFMQYLIFMQLCCMKIEYVQFPCNNVACNNQHTRCNKVARNISTYTMQQSCMQQCCLQLCCMENLTYTMQQSCRQQLHATLLHRVWWALYSK